MASDYWLRQPQRRRRPPPFHVQRKIRLARMFDTRSPEERRVAIVVYDCAFALWQEWHDIAVRARNIQRLRGIFKR